MTHAHPSSPIFVYLQFVGVGRRSPKPGELRETERIQSAHVETVLESTVEMGVCNNQRP